MVIVKKKAYVSYTLIYVLYVLRDFHPPVDVARFSTLQAQPILADAQQYAIYYILNEPNIGNKATLKCTIIIDSGIEI